MMTLNPVFFFFIPSFINMFGMLSDADFGELPKLLVLMFGLFPIFNPIIVIYFTEDYKRYVMRQSISSALLLVLMFGLFPIFNPIIVIYFTEDYKRYVMRQSISSALTHAVINSLHFSIV
ncbi:hypothetical protein PRIPAC_82536 [Pristionchus pacificus]|uniref:Uncharacterized protein n=1 Tax=Pristionchus pacificus TaxID=54126 RepID=A0A2A6C219_PRIPA|nr:hypothetical protein PRIPAC_82536 [Pristionchus pacificus]|eukprot:PDM72282.1 hypothetical protein PRIPAC_38716 [Pristionchus pacificus]